MSNMSRGRKFGSSAKFWRLVREGPHSTDIYGGGLNQKTRLGYDIRNFDVGSARFSGDVPKTKAVYYLNGYHSFEEVVEAWIDLNRSVLEKYAPISRRAVSIKCNKEFSDAMLEPDRSWLSERTNTDGGEGGASPGECSYCGEKYVTNLPNHLRSCDSI